jgi:hypothetical protein
MVVSVVGTEKSPAVIVHLGDIKQTQTVSLSLDQSLLENDVELLLLGLLLDDCVGFVNQLKQSGETEILQLKETILAVVAGIKFAV